MSFAGREMMMMMMMMGDGDGDVQGEFVVW